MTNDKFQIIEQSLDKYLPKERGTLSQAMRYSVFAGGKRFRPMICVEAAKLFGSNLSSVIPAACAIEVLHTFTLIHDDLPAMDDSDLRRGKPACHKKFGEDIAILAGDALNTLAFEIIAKHCKSPKAMQISAILGEALSKVVEGQVLDLESEGKNIDLKTLQKMHEQKTSALIEASVAAGAVLGGAKKRQVKALMNYGRHLGLAFQITDDILDATADTKKLGKPAGQDVENKKSTYVSILGLKKAKELAERHYRSAINGLKIFGSKGKVLADIADFVVRRSK